MLIIITEIITIIEIIEITITAKKHSKEPSSVMKDIEAKETQIKSFKKRTNKVSEKAKSKQKNLDARAQKESLEELISSVSNWLPVVEASVLRQTPVSVDFNVLKPQHTEITVSTIEINLQNFWCS